MTSKERFHNLLDYKYVDRPIFGFWCTGWPETIERWKKEGYNPDKPLFIQDIKFVGSDWFYPDPPFEKRVIEEDRRTILYINEEGVLMRERRDYPQSSMPQFIRFPVETRQDFREFWQERMKPDLKMRIGEDYKEKLSSFGKCNYPLFIFPDRWAGFFGPLRNLVGVEKLCLLFYDDPEFVEEMMDALADFIIAMMDKILRYTDIDMFGFWEDMAYKTGPLIGPELVKEFMLPPYKKVVSFLNSKGVKWISLDSDGNVTKLIPIWLEGGINVIFPFEVQAGMDVIRVRKEFGKELRMIGGFDKRVCAKGKGAINREFDRLEPLVKEGGYILSPDHSFPPDVSFENYRYFIEEWKARFHKQY